MHFHSHACIFLPSPVLTWYYFVLSTYLKPPFHRLFRMSPLCAWYFLFLFQPILSISTLFLPVILEYWCWSSLTSFWIRANFFPIFRGRSSFFPTPVTFAIFFDAFLPNFSKTFIYRLWNDSFGNSYFIGVFFGQSFDKVILFRQGSFCLSDSVFLGFRSSVCIMATKFINPVCAFLYDVVGVVWCWVVSLWPPKINSCPTKDFELFLSIKEVGDGSCWNCVAALCIHSYFKLILFKVTTLERVVVFSFLF